jgi:hypothetical protein
MRLIDIGREFFQFALGEKEVIQKSSAKDDFK